MKANELRIGNFIKFESTGVIEQVYNIAHNLRWSGNKEEGFKNTLDINDVEIVDVLPIPLTEEWLIKFGFEKTELNNGIIKQFYHDCTPPEYRNEYGLFFRFGEMRDEKYKMYWYASGPVNSSMHSFPCKYVHQLQNLYFALTGEELTSKP